MIQESSSHSLTVFFYAHGDHRHLHSFPTRRSSDLEPTSRSRRSGRRCCPSRTGASPARARWARTRSEEHTSELQSQSNLVCRLLLEKKNTGPLPEPLAPRGPVILPVSRSRPFITRP